MILANFSQKSNSSVIPVTSSGESGSLWQRFAAIKAHLHDGLERAVALERSLFEMMNKVWRTHVRAEGGNATFTVGFN